MIVYKVSENSVIEVECEKMEYPLTDSDGDTIYKNTHFYTKKAAYMYIISDHEAGVSLATKRVKEARDIVKKYESDLADECIVLEQLKNEFEKLEEN